MNKNTFIILLLITCLAAFLRFHQLGEIPVGFHRDEAFLGYNAFSLLKNGTDMTGNVFPLHLESFLYSPAGYSYLSIPFIQAFGLSSFSTRFASALFGTLTVFLVYFLTTLLLKKLPHVHRLGLFSALTLAITPWHINLSRTATENVVIVFFLTLGIFLYLKSKRLVTLLSSYVCFGICLLTYQAPRAFLPLFIPLLLLYDIKKTHPFQKKIYSVVCYTLFIIIPVIVVLRTPNLATRMNTLSIFSTEKTQLIIDEQIRNSGIMNVPPFIVRIFNNKVLGYTNAFINNFFLHTSHQFLFTDAGYPDRYRVPYSGILFLSFMPLLAIGVVFLWKKTPANAFLLTSWLVLALAGSALTYDDIPNLQRTLIVFPPLAIIIASGMYTLSNHGTPQKLLLGLLGLVLVFEIVNYQFNYYVHQIVYRPWYRQEGYQSLIRAVNERKNLYNNIVVTNKESAPAIFFLFYSQYDPKTYITEVRSSKLRDFDRVNFNKYIFSEEECPFSEITERDPVTAVEQIICNGERNTLYVNYGSCTIPQHCGKLITEITRNDKTTVFTLVEAK